MGGEDKNQPYLYRERISGVTGYRALVAPQIRMIINVSIHGTAGLSYLWLSLLVIMIFA
jgi:hypothetical protein